MRKRISAGMAVPRDGRCMQCGWMSGDISCTSGEKRTHPSYGKIKNSTWELFCGRGINSYHEMMKGGKLVQVVAHNQFIQSLYNQGLFGCISFVIMSVSAIFRNIKKRTYISAAMLGTLALAMSLSINPSIKAFWNLLIYSAFTLNITNNQKEVDSI